MEKPRIKETIIVEGRYDRNTLLQYVDAGIVETSGFGVFNDPEITALIRTLAEKNGVIVMTDSDGAGFLIRNHIRGSVTGGRVLHAYIPEIEGRERRKRRPGAEGLLGVEGMNRETVIKALRDCGATFGSEEPREPREQITKTDLYMAGLSGAGGAVAARDELKRKLGLPSKLSPNALLEVLNALYTREEFLTAAEEIHKTS